MIAPFLVVGATGNLGSGAAQALLDAGLPVRVAGTSPDPLNWFDSVNETQVLAGQREFRERLSAAGIPSESHEVPGGHIFRPDMFRLDLDGIIARLRPAGVRSADDAL